MKFLVGIIVYGAMLSISFTFAEGMNTILIKNEYRVTPFTLTATLVIYLILLKNASFSIAGFSFESLAKLWGGK